MRNKPVSPQPSLVVDIINLFNPMAKDGVLVCFTCLLVLYSFSVNYLFNLSPIFLLEFFLIDV